MFADIDVKSVLNTLYAYVKTRFGMENYLSLLSCKSSRICLTKLHISAHKLGIESARYGQNRSERQERLCQVFNFNETEDSFYTVRSQSSRENSKFYFYAYLITVNK
jgi:hypothetical protein